MSSHVLGDPDVDVGLDRLAEGEEDGGRQVTGGVDLHHVAHAVGEPVDAEEEGVQHLDRLLDARPGQQEMLTPVLELHHLYSQPISLACIYYCIVMGCPN